jgi:hypothetical protein
MDQKKSSEQPQISACDARASHHRPEGDAMMRRFAIMCGLFETAYEIKSLELQRRHPEASEAWIHAETLRLIEAGTR